MRKFHLPQIVADVAPGVRAGPLEQQREVLAALPTEEELLERLLREAEPFAMKRSSARIIRKDRDAA